MAYSRIQRMHFATVLAIIILFEKQQFERSFLIVCTLRTFCFFGLFLAGWNLIGRRAVLLFGGLGGWSRSRSRSRSQLRPRRTFHWIDRVFFGFVFLTVIRTCIPHSPTPL